VCARLNCHWQTLLYRQKKGDLTPIRIGRRKYYAVGEVEQLLKHKPVAHKPHYSKRRTGSGGGPGDGCIHGSVWVVSEEKPKPTLWQRIKSLFV
jgi:hypothetical protein